MIRQPARRPCGSCPYRRDVASGVWAAEEYERLPGYDGATWTQSPGVFLCHQQDGRVCAGWAGCHDLEENLAMRFAADLFSPEDYEATMTYQTDVPLFATGAEAAEHGLAEIETPGDDHQAGAQGRDVVRHDMEMVRVLLTDRRIPLSVRRDSWLALDLEVDADIWIEPCASGSDRGRIKFDVVSRDPIKLTIDEYDSFPRYYFSPVSAAEEIHFWLSARGLVSPLRDAPGVGFDRQPWTTSNRCPVCGATAASRDAEIAHMETEHPDVIEERMTRAGFRRGADGQWVDTLASDDT